MKEVFKDIRIKGSISIKLDKLGREWTESKAQILNDIIEITKRYQAKGFSLTLRQLYYQLVAADKIPNHDKVYKKLSKLKDDCVYSGLVDWALFEDRGRVPKIAYFEESIKGAIERTKEFYKLDRQKGQEKHIEVWTEKDAISDILKRVVDPYTIRLVINKGYSSSTAMYGAYQRFFQAIEEGKKIVILYFGDHDPSGLDMVRDIEERILFFLSNGQRKNKIVRRVQDWLEKEENPDLDRLLDEYYGLNDWMEKREDPETGEKLEVFNHWKAYFKTKLEVKHVGLTMEQIKEINPPHNPAKITDTRANKYIQKFGPKSWEVDALNPEVMTDIVREAILEEINHSTYLDTLEKEEQDLKKLKEIIKTIDLK